jgi:hypothetical protein
MKQIVMSNKGKLLVSSKTNNSSLCLNSLAPPNLKKNPSKRLKPRKTKRTTRQEAKKKELMPPSTKEYHKTNMDICCPGVWPQPDRFDLYVAPPAPLNSTEYIMERYEAERVLSEMIVSTPDRLYDNGRPFNSSGSMFGVVNIGSPVPTRCA